MVQVASKRFVMEDRLNTELSGISTSIGTNATAINNTNTAVALVNSTFGRGTVTNYKVTNLAALDAIADAQIGDIAYMTSPGTGIESLKWEAFAGSGSTIDWHIVDTVRADTQANLDVFASAVNALIGDLSFVVGGLAYVSTTGVAYKFVTTGGAKQSLTGLVPIVPTSVTAGGGTASVTTNGAITLSAVTTAGVLIDGCFTSSFDNYLIHVDVPTTSAANALIAQFRLAGAAVAGALYDSEGMYATGASAVPVAGQLLAQTSWLISGISTVTGTSHSCELKLFGPALAQATRATTDAVATTNPMTAALTGGSIHKRALLHRTATAYDGILIAPNTGTITGTIRIYGYMNLG